MAIGNQNHQRIRTALLTNKDTYRITAVYGNVAINHFGDEAIHSCVEVHHPDGSVSGIGSGLTSDIRKRVDAAIEHYKNTTGVA